MYEEPGRQSGAGLENGSGAVGMWESSSLCVGVLVEISLAFMVHAKARSWVDCYFLELL